MLKEMSNIFKFGGLIWIFCVLLFIWLVTRELRTWYWKQNDIIKLLEGISDTLDEMNGKLDRNIPENKNVNIEIDE